MIMAELSIDLSSVFLVLLLLTFLHGVGNDLHAALLPAALSYSHHDMRDQTDNDDDEQTGSEQRDQAYPFELAVLVEVLRARMLHKSEQDAEDHCQDSLCDHHEDVVNEELERSCNYDQ
eukprot:CAMPEP_0168327052 /NCGR_PEP_ID=MMETSP0213-20121227/5674_1 /TAXON_ID=151035 /ORGANISM="Euplotes harpa, Strain FSP1.4" /LENGTH=118 /DNA_ID=CAMNT_0008329895 /DNA_START=153 /DNA_END=508 /DNA_ORIENTATION=-